MNAPAHRITLSPEVCQGKPTIRNMRFTAAQMLQLLASGMSHQELLDNYRFLEEADIQACLWYASQIADTHPVAALAG